MARPTFAQYKNLSQDQSNIGLTVDNIRSRMLKCLAAVVSGQNPDGTAL